MQPRPDPSAAPLAHLADERAPAARASSLQGVGGNLHSQETAYAAVVRRWIEAGNTGTVTEACMALGLGRPTVYLYLRRLTAEGFAAVICARRSEKSRGRKIELVWGRAPEIVAVSQDIVSRALAARSEIERVWT